MIRLHPPQHSVPDNIWHTLLISAISAFFVFQTGQQIIELYLNDLPVTHVEQQLLQGEGTPFQIWLTSFAQEDAPSLLWNRVLAGCGWMFALAVIMRSLKASSSFVESLPSLILLFAFPGLSVRMCSSGSGSLAVCFFLLAFFSISANESKFPLLRGGGMAAIAVWMDPVWILPSLGLLVGCWEGFRSRLKWVAIGFGSAILAGLLLSFLLSSFGFSFLHVGSATPGGSTWSWGGLFNRYLLLILNLILLLVYGSRRRGIGWWTLVWSVPLLFLNSVFHVDIALLCIPLWIFSAVGLAKLPLLLDLRFPRAYQSILLCQLLLWMPVYLGNRPLHLYPVFSTEIQEVPQP